MLDNFAEYASITAANDKNGLGVGVRIHGEMGDHLLIAVFISFSERRHSLAIGDLREFIALGALYHVVQHKHGAVIARFEDEDVLVLGFLVVKNLIHLEGHRLARPHIGDLAEPAIWVWWLAMAFNEDDLSVNPR